MGFGEEWQEVEHGVAHEQGKRDDDDEKIKRIEVEQRPTPAENL